MAAWLDILASHIDLSFVVLLYITLSVLGYTVPVEFLYDTIFRQSDLYKPDCLFKFRLSYSEKHVLISPFLGIPNYRV